MGRVEEMTEEEKEVADILRGMRIYSNGDGRNINFSCRVNWKKKQDGYKPYMGLFTDFYVVISGRTIKGISRWNYSTATWNKVYHDSLHAKAIFLALWPKHVDSIDGT